MAGETERIEKEIAQAREELAKTLDQLAVRANPERLANDAKSKALAVLASPGEVRPHRSRRARRCGRDSQDRPLMSREKS